MTGSTLMGLFVISFCVILIALPLGREWLVDRQLRRERERRLIEEHEHGREEPPARG
jgi:hypothetical protein